MKSATDKMHFVTLITHDPNLKDLQKRIDKLSLIQVWVMRASTLLERYLRTLDLLSTEKDPTKTGLLIEESDCYFMSSVSYFLRSFTHQTGSYFLSIKEVTSDRALRTTFQMLKDLRDDEYVHWKGARSTAHVKYSFKATSQTECEFAQQVQVNFKETIGPEPRSDEIRTLFKATIEYIDQRRNSDLQKIRERLKSADAWRTTELLNDAGEKVIKRT